MKALEVEGVGKRFGDVVALDGVSLSVEEGQIFGLLGPNGAGKTTLLSIVSGFLRPDEGRVRVLGQDARHMRGLRGRFSILPQDAGLQPAATVLDQLVLFDRLAGANSVDARRAAREALDRIGLAEEAERPGRALSHGMHKRVALAQALLGDPEVVLLDEPTAGLDPRNARRVRDLVREMRAQRTVVISSHNLNEIEELCDEVVILHRGRVALGGAVASLLSASGSLRVELARPLPDDVHRALQGLAGVRDIEPDAGTGFALRLDAPDAAARDAVVKRILALLLERDLVPRRLQPGESLESRFLAITGGGDAAGSGEAAVWTRPAR